jgi:hypothetical protein
MSSTGVENIVDNGSVVRADAAPSSNFSRRGRDRIVVENRSY